MRRVSTAIFHLIRLPPGPDREEQRDQHAREKTEPADGLSKGAQWHYLIAGGALTATVTAL
jgi:hypothetical protein